MSVFKRKANRFCVWFESYGFVPVADRRLDDKPEFLTARPKRVGDEAIIRVEGRHRRVILLRSHGMCKDSLYLVDRGPA